MLCANRTLSPPGQLRLPSFIIAIGVGCDEGELLGAGLTQRLRTVDAGPPAPVAPCPRRIRILR